MYNVQCASNIFFNHLFRLLSDKEKDRQYNEKWCRQASCNSPTKSTILRQKESKHLHCCDYGALGLACPAHHPKGSRHLANWWRYIKRQVWGGEAWRVEVGEGKKAWERLRRGQDDTSMSAPRRKICWTASRSSHTLKTLLLPCNAA